MREGLLLFFKRNINGLFKYKEIFEHRREKSELFIKFHEGKPLSMLACEIMFLRVDYLLRERKHIPVLFNELDDVDCDLIEI